MTHFEMTITNDVLSLRPTRQALREKIADSDFSYRLNDILLATDEALQNCITHAFAPNLQGDTDGEIFISLEIGESVIICIEDTAPPVDIAKIKSRELDDVRPGGLGVHFIKSLTDEVTWNLKNGRNCLELRWENTPQK
jgi:anti-sigma regulatory factor (Ser/Thr protein kinase)